MLPPQIAAPQRDADMTPLFVDVDGTLTRADISLESFVAFARSGIISFLRLLVWLVRGREVAKAMVARYAPVDPARLPYREDVLRLIAQAQAQGQPVILASASHRRNIQRVAYHLGLSEPVIASHAHANLKGKEKLAAIRAYVGVDGAFDYVGDSKADRCLWAEAREGWSAGHLPTSSAVQPVGARRPPVWRALIKAMRPHQWAKNALVLVPVLTSGLLTQPTALLTAIGAAALLCLIASSIYLFNDLLDIESDRAHRSKWRRPIAHGDLPIPAAIIASALFALTGLGGGWWLGGFALTFWLFAYIVLTTAYSLRLKAVMVGDAIVLASLYTVRIWIGGVAIGVEISFWLLLFAVFLFLSLAYLKRYIEMRDAVEAPDRLLIGRGYVGGDLDVVMMAGVSSGMVSILVLTLFANDPATATHYAAPNLLLLLCLPLLYWLNRIWMMARRGEVDGDPVAFAIKDRRSILVGASLALIFLLALYSPQALLPWISARAF